MTPNRLVFIAVAAAAAVGLAGCGTPACVTYTAYRDSVSPPPLRVPSGMEAPNRSGDMSIPGGAPGAGGSKAQEDRCLAAPPAYYADAPNPEGLPVRASGAAAITTAPGPGAGPAVGASLVSQSVAEFLDAWANAWSRRDAEDWFGYYAADYAPAGYASHEEWRAEQLPRFEIPAATTVEPGTLEVETLSDGRARARFVQSFGTPPDVRRVVKEVVLEPAPQGGDWRIAEEQILDVL